MSKSVSVSTVAAVGRGLAHGASRVASIAVAAFAVGLFSPAQAATDISNVPIVTTTSGAVKPNVMLLMDASDSMSYTHLPDQVEGITKVNSVGYKSSQCNILYYDPKQTYLLPRKSDGSEFVIPADDNLAFTKARFAGFGDFYLTPDPTETNLASGFKAYYQSTQAPGLEDVAQAAYYFRLDGGAPLDAKKPFLYKPCTDIDVTQPNVSGSQAASEGGGMWTKVIVGTNSGVAPHVDERRNFAIWYSYYRTRIALTKSAASLAFTPLTDTYRVGFITVQPKTNKNDAGINGEKYLEINDFGSTHRNAWFAKLFSQTPFGASPAREGLARVGRHYAGKHDSINTDMTGDPLQYSCQQNFTIMTTDGYWNTQTETPDTGSLKGGPLMIDGVTKIGQQDGDDTDPNHNCPLGDLYCPRPIWDGNAGTTVVEKDAWNTYDHLACTLATKNRYTYKTVQTRSSWTKAFTTTQQRTQYYRTTKEQIQATTSNITKTKKKIKKTTEQFVLRHHTVVEERYQVWRSTFENKKTTTQLTSTSSQVRQRRYETHQHDTQQAQTSVQYVLVKTQVDRKTEQAFREQRRYYLEKQQTIKHVYYYGEKTTGENYDAVPSCTVGPNCKIYEVFGPEPVLASNCTNNVETSGLFRHTDCTSGTPPTTMAKTAVALCTVQDSNSMAPNYVRTICTDESVTPPQPVFSCTPMTAGDFTRDICTYPAGSNNETVAGAASCMADPGTSYPYVKVSCPPGAAAGTTYPDYCDTSFVAEPNNVTVSCTLPKGTNYGGAAVDPAVPVATCTPTTLANNQKITCAPLPDPVPEKAVIPSDCVAPFAGPVGNVYRTCTNVAVAGDAYPAWTFVASCSAGLVGTTVTECDYPPATNYVNKPISQSATCSTVVPGPGNDYLSVSCDNLPGPNNQPNVAVPPSTCVASDGTTGPNFIKVDCTGPTQTSGPTVVDPTTCTPFGYKTLPGPGYVVELCDQISLGAPAVSGTCVPGNTGFPLWIETVCGPQDVEDPVQFCNEGEVTGPSYDQYTCAKPVGPNNVANLPVTTCTDQTATGPIWLRVSCDTQTTFGAQVVAASTCSPGTDTANELEMTTCVSNPAGPYATPTFVQTCDTTPGAGPEFLVTTCDKPVGANNVTTPTPVTSCGPTGPSYDANNVKTTCTYVDDLAYVQGPAACVPQSPTDLNGYVTVSCDTQTSKPSETSPTCSAGLSGGANQEVISCTALPGSTVDSTAPCTSFVDSGTNETVTCAKVQTSGPIADDNCTAGTLSNAPYTITECTSGSGAGLKLVVTSSFTTTTSKKSGNQTIGTPVVVPSPGTSTDLTACLAPADPLLTITLPNPKHATNDPAPPGTCTTWPCVLSSVTVDAGSKNSLADVAHYYYKTDLRDNDTAFPDNVKPVGTGAEDDKAPHQHMTTFVVGLGVSGTLNYRPDYRSTATTTGDFAEIRCPSNTNCKNWPIWPDPALDYTDTDNYNNDKSIDDFWHTAVNGRGRFFSAVNPSTVVSGLGESLNSIDIQTAAGAADAASTFEPVAGNNSVYSTSYQTGKKENAWIGNLEAFNIDLITGGLGTAIWSARDLLDTRTGQQCDSRDIFVLRPGFNLPSGYSVTALGGGQNLADFSYDTYACNAVGAPTGSPRNGLDATEKLNFDTSEVSAFSHYAAMSPAQRAAAPNANLVNFLRGQRGFEGFVPASTTLYRKRNSILGDLVNSQPVYVGVPFARYQENNYGQFITDNLNRVPMVYVGGNDGMLHAFYATTDISDPQRGQEAWAVIPQTVLGNLYKLADDNYWNNHQFYVDGSPVVSDVWDGTNWRTILVGGLNAGGKAYYALDVTNPKAPKGLWEFKATSGTCASPATGQKSDCNLGLTFGKPIVTKVNGTWAVLVTSGYNNNNGNSKDGSGFAYALNALTGEIIDKIDTNFGTSADPSGLAQLNNFVDNTFVDNANIRAYGGDLAGNIWRFTFSPSPSVTKLAQALDQFGNAQPITTRPEIAEIDNKPIVFVGTGKLLGTADLTDTKKQSIYAIIDPLTSTVPAVYPDLRAVLRPLTMSFNAGNPTAPRTISCNDASACARTAGWYVDLPESGERINVPMALNMGTLVAASNVPTPAACTVGGHSWFNYLDFRTGAAVEGSGLVDPGDPNSGQIASQYIADSLVAGFNVYKLPPLTGNPNGRFTTKFHQTDAKHYDGPMPPPPAPPLGKRISWREIAQ